MALANLVPKVHNLGPSFFSSRAATRDTWDTQLSGARKPESFNIRSATLLKPGTSNVDINETSRTFRRSCTRMGGTSSTPSAADNSNMSSVSTLVTTYISVREAIRELYREASWKPRKHAIGYVCYRPAQLEQYLGIPSDWGKSCKDECEKLGIDYEKTRAHLEWIAVFASSIAKLSAAVLH
jgi:hypothetical protein